MVPCHRGAERDGSDTALGVGLGWGACPSRESEEWELPHCAGRDAGLATARNTTITGVVVAKPEVRRRNPKKLWRGRP